MTCHASVERDGHFWLIRVAGVGHTQARHLREVDTMARDRIAVMTDVDPDMIELDVSIPLPESVQAHLDAAAQLREQSAETQAHAAAELRAAARELADDGVPLRDIGRLLGVSHQRAHQLVRS